MPMQSIEFFVTLLSFRPITIWSFISTKTGRMRYALRCGCAHQFQPVHRPLGNLFNGGQSDWQCDSNVASCLQNRLVRRILNDYKVEYISFNVTHGIKITLDTVNATEGRKPLAFTKFLDANLVFGLLGADLPVVIFKISSTKSYSNFLVDGTQWLWHSSGIVWLVMLVNIGEDQKALRTIRKNAESMKRRGLGILRFWLRTHI